MALNSDGLSTIQKFGNNVMAGALCNCECKPFCTIPSYAAFWHVKANVYFLPDVIGDLKRVLEKRCSNQCM
jgi:hypothetical protein